MNIAAKPTTTLFDYRWNGVTSSFIYGSVLNSHLNSCKKIEISIANWDFDDLRKTQNVAIWAKHNFSSTYVVGSSFTNSSSLFSYIMFYIY